MEPEPMGPARHRVALPATLDMSNGPTIVVQLHKLIAVGSVVDLDCTALEYLDSGGATALLQVRRLAAKRGATLRLINLSGSPLQFLTILGVADLFDLPHD
jgi:anti-anti-sigma factor